MTAHDARAIELDITPQTLDDRVVAIGEDQLRARSPGKYAGHADSGAEFEHACTLQQGLALGREDEVAQHGHRLPCDVTGLVVVGGGRLFGEIQSAFGSDGHLKIGEGR